MVLMQVRGQAVLLRPTASHAWLQRMARANSRIFRNAKLRERQSSSRASTQLMPADGGEAGWGDVDAIFAELVTCLRGLKHARTRITALLICENFLRNAQFVGPIEKADRQNQGWHPAQRYCYTK